MSRTIALLSTCSVRDVSNDYISDASNDLNTVNRNRIGGLPDILFLTEGEKSAGNETSFTAHFF